MPFIYFHIHLAVMISPWGLQDCELNSMKQQNQWILLSHAFIFFKGPVHLLFSADGTGISCMAFFSFPSSLHSSSCLSMLQVSIVRALDRLDRQQVQDMGAPSETHGS